MRSAPLLVLAILLLVGCAGRPGSPADAAPDPGAGDEGKSRPGNATSEGPDGTADGEAGPWTLHGRGNLTLEGRATAEGHVACEFHTVTVTEWSAQARHVHMLEAYVDGEALFLGYFLVDAGREAELQVGPVSSGPGYDAVVTPVFRLLESSGAVILDGTFGLEVDVPGRIDVVYTVIGKSLTDAAQEPAVTVEGGCGKTPTAWAADGAPVAWLSGDGGALAGVHMDLAGASVQAEVARDVVGRGRAMAVAWGPFVVDARTPEGDEQWVLDSMALSWQAQDGGPGAYSLTGTGASPGSPPFMMLLDLVPIAHPGEAAPLLHVGGRAE
jgi:hypothetical protein